MTSIKDVASAAGVAISTVSKVLNNYPNVSESTREKVMTAVRELHFVPNTVASALSSKRSGRIALLLNPRITSGAIDEVNMQYLSGAINQAQQMHLDIITIFLPMIEHMSLEQLIQYLQTQSISGLVIYGINKEEVLLHELVKSELFKIVVVDAPIINTNTSCISVDNEQAQYDVAKLTVTQNKSKKVLYLSGSEEGYVTDARLRGMKRLAEEEKLELMVRNGAFSEKRARELTKRFGKNKDCVICASDMMAIGAMRELIEMDIFRPVCGFDGITLMGYTGKQMNTVKQDFNHISSEAIVEANQLLNGETGRKIVMPHEIVRLRYEDVIV